MKPPFFYMNAPFFLNFKEAFGGNPKGSLIFLIFFIKSP